MEKRRTFLKNGLMLCAAAGASTLPLQIFGTTAVNWAKEVLTFGLLTDLHHDLIKDGVERVNGFVSEMNNIKPDFILQIGDFCTPKPANKPLMDAWNSFNGARYHVIGNHDMDGGFTHDQVVDFWNAKGKYYSFDLKDYHFIVLNGNERPENDTSKGYPRSISKTQYNWLKKDLEETKLPVLIFCHQGIDNDLDGIKEGAMLRLLFERVNKAAGVAKIKAVFSGHNHEDYHNCYNGVNYVQINSASYQFGRNKSGYEFVHTKAPLWATVSVLSNGNIRIKGTSSVYQDGSTVYAKSDYDGYPTVPTISDRVITFSKKA